MGAADSGSPDRHGRDVERRRRHDSRSPPRHSNSRHRDRSRSRERHRDRSIEHSRERGHDSRRGDDKHGGDERHHSSRGDRRDAREHQQPSRRHDSSSRPREDDGYRDDSRGGGAGGGSSRHGRDELPLPPPPPDRQPDRQQQGPQRPRGGGGGGGGRRRDDGDDGDMGSKQRWGKPEEWEDERAAAAPLAPKEQPNMGLSGKLAAESNKAADGKTVMKYQPPPEARVCKKPTWRLYIFKGDAEAGAPLSLTQHPFYLFGKDRGVADIPTDHPSCSRQHAVLVFREVEVDAPDGLAVLRRVKPYLLDLESVNGTTINGERLEPARHYELISADVIRFGHSSREYVIMNEAEAGAGS